MYAPPRAMALVEAGSSRTRGSVWLVCADSFVEQMTARALTSTAVRIMINQFGL